MKMKRSVAFAAKRNEVLLDICTEVGANQLSFHNALGVQ
jgi:hypothetical protein